MNHFILFSQNLIYSYEKKPNVHRYCYATNIQPGGVKTSKPKLKNLNTSYCLR